MWDQGFLLSVEESPVNRGIHPGGIHDHRLSGVGEHLNMSGGTFPVKPQAIGATFESMFLMTARANRIAITKIPDSCRSVGKNQIIRVKSPWDWILTYNRKTAFIDTKTTRGSSFPCSKICEHQVNELIQHEYAGASAGYVIWLRSTNRVFFMSAKNLAGLMDLGGSFSEIHQESVFLGTNIFDVRRIFRPDEEV